MRRTSFADTVLAKITFTVQCWYYNKTPWHVRHLSNITSDVIFRPSLKKSKDYFVQFLTLGVWCLFIIFHGSIYINVIYSVRAKRLQTFRIPLGVSLKCCYFCCHIVIALKTYWTFDYKHFPKNCIHFRIHLLYPIIYLLPFYVFYEVSCPTFHTDVVHHIFYGRFTSFTNVWNQREKKRQKYLMFSFVHCHTKPLLNSNNWLTFNRYSKRIKPGAGDFDLSAIEKSNFKCRWPIEIIRSSWRTVHGGFGPVCRHPIAQYSHTSCAEKRAWQEMH